MSRNSIAYRRAGKLKITNISLGLTKVRTTEMLASMAVGGFRTLAAIMAPCSVEA